MFRTILAAVAVVTAISFATPVFFSGISQTAEAQDGQKKKQKTKSLPDPRKGNRR